MHFSTAAFVLASAAVAYAADIQVLVGDGGALAFNPTSVTAQSGDNIIFEFRAKNHSVTQSTFATPCTLQTTPQTGIDSGFQPVPSGATTFPQWSITVDDSTTPLWFFCAQTNPADHCNAGMVFAVNPTAQKTFQAFQAAAMSASPGAPAPGGSVAPSGAVSGVAGSATGIIPTVTGLPSGALTTGAPGATSLFSLPGTAPSGFSTVATPTNTPAASTNGTTAGTTPGNGAFKLSGSASTLVALVGLMAGLML